MRILQDETFVTSPIKTAMDYTWSAVSANWKNTIVVALALILLSVLSIVPLLGFVASVVQAIVLYALGYWIVDRIKGVPDVATFKERAATEDFKAMMVEFFSPAAGFYVGFMVFSIIMMIITVGIFWITGGFGMMSMVMEQQNIQNATPEETYALYAQFLGTSTPALLFVLITSLFFSYLWPLVYGYALFQRTFSDAFNAVFMFFSKRFWQAAFTGSYFKIVTLWMLILFGVGIVMGISIGTVILLPLGILVLLWMVYFTAVVSAETYNISENI